MSVYQKQDYSSNWSRFFFFLLCLIYWLSICLVAKGSGADPKPKPYIINQPYTPKIKRLTLGYSALLEIDLTKSDFNQQIDRLYHIEPFGYRDLAGYASRPHPFLPSYENEGELFIGIKALAPPQDLSLLFQLAEGSADPSLEREPVHWSFLDGNNWYSLEKGQLLSDSTNGLLNSGILKFSLAPVQPSSLLPSDQYWLRATIARNSRSVADIIAIQTQAVSATFEDHGNDPGRLSQPLAAGSISGLAEPQPQVKAIHQPFSSFGGKNPEQPGQLPHPCQRAPAPQEPRPDLLGLRAHGSGSIPEHLQGEVSSGGNFARPSPGRRDPDCRHPRHSRQTAVRPVRTQTTGRCALADRAIPDQTQPTVCPFTSQEPHLCAAQSPAGDSPAPGCQPGLLQEFT